MRPKVAGVVKHSCTSGVSHFWLGSRAHLRALKAFDFLMLKNPFSHILETLSILTASSTPKTDKKKVHYIVCQSI